MMRKPSRQWHVRSMAGLGCGIGTSILTFLTLQRKAFRIRDFARLDMAFEGFTRKTTARSFHLYLLNVTEASLKARGNADSAFATKIAAHDKFGIFPYNCNREPLLQKPKLHTTRQKSTLSPTWDLSSLTFRLSGSIHLAAPGPE